MSLAQQVICHAIAKSMVVSAASKLTGDVAWSVLSPAARTFALEAAANVETALIHHGVPAAEIMEGLVQIAVPADYDAADIALRSDAIFGKEVAHG